MKEDEKSPGLVLRNPWPQVSGHLEPRALRPLVRAPELCGRRAHCRATAVSRPQGQRACRGQSGRWVDKLTQAARSAEKGLQAPLTSSAGVSVKS